MSDQEILTKAIQKAIDGGWMGSYLVRGDSAEWRFINATPRAYFSIVRPSPKAFDDYIETKLYVHEFIFNHDFCKALWPPVELMGLKPIIDSLDSPINTKKDIRSNDEQLLDAALGMAWLPSWKYNLIKMVISPDPIKYLGQHL